ncbi:PREDICTED: pentatricopeptide repeat-containing protein At4g37170 [Brassica oleracea var. oleracea]|uniref:DYW domain-containing protein n=1 Tax=Brassica oleracea var. oleracea TaxID=109376 RepID=A0A0D3A1F1_BRAOL|nr:PREDICTED: pentatricopeptide repeat-containing protein At4g37170 [Brassica oleracea var. oleracea]
MNQTIARKLSTFVNMSSSYASMKRFPEKKFFNSNQEDVSVVERLCKGKRFSEAIDVLCGQKQLIEAVQLLSRAKKPPPASTYCNLIQICTQRRALEEGKKVHRHIIASGFVPGVVICNRLMRMYAKCGSLVDARKVFDEMPQRDVCSWNVMVSGYAEAGLVEEARKVFDEMPERDSYSWTAMVNGYVKRDQPEEALVMYSLMQKERDSKANVFTVSSAVAAAAEIACIRRGREIHGHVVRAGLDSDEVLWSSLMDMYGKCGCIDEARRIFDKIVVKDVVSWTSMIDRYFKSRRWREGFSLFSELIGSNARPNEYTFAGVLNACTDLTTEEVGKQVHGYMTRVGYDPYSFASSSLVDLYTKCGNMESAKRVVDGCDKPDLFSWTSLIGGYAQNGEPEKALKYFDLLLESGTKPDHITFVSVLSACTHAGLVEKGLEYFHSITEKHGLSHTDDHYTCLVDLLARSGRFEELKDVISEMPMTPSKFLWASVLGGCSTHGNVDQAEEAARELFEIEPENPATYVTMANIYAAAGKWEEEGRMRKRMNQTGVTKTPGSSWTEVKRKRHVFIAGDTSNPMHEQIVEYLGELREKMKEEGYVPATSLVLHDVEDEQKEENLVYHSEKLAVAFAILSTPEGTGVKVFKNLRSCVDCHSAIKFISKITKRKITVRDSARFHCFENGQCSCRDYW